MDKILEMFGKELIEEIVKKSNSFVEVTRELGLKENKRHTIERSIKRMGLSVDHFESVQRVREYKVRYDENKLKKFIDEGKNFKEILLELDILPIDSNYRTLKKYDINYSHLENKKNYLKVKWNKENLEEIVKTSISQKEVLNKMGLRAAGSNYRTLKKYIELYELDISHFIKNYDKMVDMTMSKKINISLVLVENSNYNRNHLKTRLYEEGLKERKCELCGQDENWMGRHMSLIIDHINGIHNDNRLDNLRIVCPNCNATLDTFCRGNKIIEKKNEKKEEKIKNKISSFLKRRKVERPSIEVIVKDIDEFGLEGTGRIYGVSGNSIKKWVKTYEKYKI